MSPPEFNSFNFNKSVHEAKMARIQRRLIFPLALLLAVGFYYTSSFHSSIPALRWQHGSAIAPGVLDDPEYFWRKLPTHYQLQSIRPLPGGKPLKLPKIQHQFSQETSAEKATRLERQLAVQEAFGRGWKAYREHAWLQDELAPVSGGAKNTFGGWGATLVDNLDTLWIMNMRSEFEDAVAAGTNISFETSSLTEVNVFETTIRYLGGFLSAYDLSGDQRLLRKAREVGDMLYVAFDTPNRMPITRWDVTKAGKGELQEASSWALVAEIGSLCMEFTRLSFVTGDPKWFDATERITEVLKAEQSKTKLPGSTYPPPSLLDVFSNMQNYATLLLYAILLLTVDTVWPISINPKTKDFHGDNTFSLGAMADSVFEYLPKMVALSGGLLPEYGEMYTYAANTAKKYSFYRPMTPDNADILLAAAVHVNKDGAGKEVPMSDFVGQHLVCFVGGMLAIGTKLLQRPDDLDIARKLTDGCIWTYASMPHGIMPETFLMTPCPSKSTTCEWDEYAWKKALLASAEEDVTKLTKEQISALADQVISDKRLPKGFTDVMDRRYILRPEAIESVFVLYRVTGDKSLLESAWTMFQAIQEASKTNLANSALADITIASKDKPHQTDSMESFWMGETLKYFYLIFSEPSLISLDEYVFNTEAHPFKRLLR
ncbi:glycosyl hydrolase family 47 [Apiospora phragmitis]|uniref:alpha-1,2-Mannosidase n=1 Tax=Apiospora phragmitis TaxID=2905665 RepID=A0ABR1T4A4_9PEZI